MSIRKSVAPIYLVGIVWLLYGLCFTFSGFRSYIICFLLSALAYGVGKSLFPDRVIPTPVGGIVQEAAQTKQEEKLKPKSTGNPEIDKLISEHEKAAGEMRRLNASIADPGISEQINHLERVTQKIIAKVAAEPQQLPQIRKFMNYYLPTTLKILNAYDRMASTGIDGENITTTKTRVAGMMDTIVQAYDKQLDALYGEEALDISSDITVMEQMLRAEGLGGRSVSGGGEINLKL